MILITVHAKKLACVQMQITHKFSSQMIELFRDTFCWLPLAHVLDNRVIVVHGGLFSKDGVKLSDIKSIDRHR